MRSAHGLEADVWSLGCMLYTLLVGHAPFDTDAVKSTLNRVIQAEYHLPDSLSPAACDLIRALLQKNPKNRLPLRGLSFWPSFLVCIFVTYNLDFQLQEKKSSKKFFFL